MLRLPCIAVRSTEHFGEAADAVREPKGRAEHRPFPQWGFSMATDLVRKAVEPLNRDMMTLRDMMERFWDMPSMFYPWRWVEMDDGMDRGMPAVDFMESAAEYTLRAALPGWKPEQVTITYEGGMVSIEGEVEEQAEEHKDARVHRREIRHRSFSRAFSLPTDVDSTKAHAEFKDGMLTITLPKSEVVKPKQIRITTK